MEQMGGRGLPIMLGILFLAVFCFRISCVVLDSSRAVESSRERYEKLTRDDSAFTLPTPEPLTLRVPDEPDPIQQIPQTSDTIERELPSYREIGPPFEADLTKPIAENAPTTLSSGGSEPNSEILLTE